MNNKPEIFQNKIITNKKHVKNADSYTIEIFFF